MSDEQKTTKIRALRNEVADLKRFWREDRKLCVVIIAIGILFGGLWLRNWLKDSETIKELRAELKETNKQVKEEHKQRVDLERIVAPIIRQAAREFPGEGIKIALVKIVERLELQNPIKQPLTQATARLDILADWPAATPGSLTGPMIFLGVGSGTNAVLVGMTDKYFISAVGTNQSMWSCSIDLDPTGSAFKKPILSLCNEAEYVQITMGPWHDGLPVRSGRVIFTLNGATRVEALIPPQGATSRLVSIRELPEFKKLAQDSP